MTQPEEIEGKYGQESQHNPAFLQKLCGKAAEGELHYRCRMEPVLVLPKHNYLCSIMPAKLLDFLFQLVSVLLVIWLIMAQKTFSVK